MPPLLFPNSEFDDCGYNQSQSATVMLSAYRLLLRNAPAGDEINRKTPQPMPAFIMLPRHRRQSRTLVRPSSRKDHRQAFVAFGQARSDAL